MKSIIKNTEDKRNNAYSFSSYNNNTYNPCNSKYECCI